MAAVPSREVTTTQLSAVTFGFYSDAEVRKLSVKVIKSPQTFDERRTPVASGLADPALGPHEQHSTCATCGLRSQACPGHFGHIELGVPVYNPLVIQTLYKLLRCACLHCFHLKMAQPEVDAFQRRLQLLTEGRLVEAAELAKGMAKGTLADAAPAGEDAAGTKVEVKEEEVQQAARQPIDARRGRDGRMTVHTIQALREATSEFLKRVPASKCANCSCNNPTIRKLEVFKFFQMPLALNRLTQNRMRGVDVVPILGPQATVEVQEIERQAGEQLASRKRKRGGAAEGGEGQAAAQAAVAGGREDPDLPREVADPDEAEDPDDEEGEGGQKREPHFMPPTEVYEVMRRLWANQAAVLQLLFATDAARGPHSTRSPAVGQQSWQMFFLQAVTVAPNRFRAPQKQGEQMFEHPQTLQLQQIVIHSNGIRQALQERAPDEATPAEAQDAKQRGAGRSLRLWIELQVAVNALYDSSLGSKYGEKAMGIRQQLEKKEGLFRKNMMGKRVNFAARSVISPDPYIGTGEIGVPPYFAKRLSFPERVTPYNVRELRDMVIRGPHEHPGAVAVEDDCGRVVSLGVLSKEKREGIAKQLLVPSGAGKRGTAAGSAARAGGKIVYRHLRDGDLMLTNRQPTLHKPGLMAHSARVLQGERTIRMHYANCNTFNADFDGDEINLHLPQDNLGRAEGYGIVHADRQYIVPTDGKPIRGLIQDHIVAGTLLSKRDTFLTRSEYMQLVYEACVPTRPGQTEMPNLPAALPAVLKPELLYTGKQVLSAVVAFFTRGLPPLTLTAGSKVPADYWGEDSGETQVLFRHGEMLTGCMDKAQYGTYGLVHAVQELYGSRAAGRLLSGLSRLFTAYCQLRGFTCGLDDILLQAGAEQQRQAILDRADANAMAASADFAGMRLSADELQQASARQTHAASIRQALSHRFRSRPAETGPALDSKASGAMHPLSSEVVKACLPGGMAKPFPHNCMSLMTVTGAKGSVVNFSQISCLLGQQELEGRRTPRMASGKTLPCFGPYDAGARAGGFIGDRFLTGLRPQEYYFHCMAGRDGLVDTTVKTSRSGYLQRCLVKNLESLRVHYDSTVRDDTDGSVVQFQYGEDGIDVMQVGFLRQFGFLARNVDRFAQQLDASGAQRTGHLAGLSAWEADAEKAVRQRARRLQKGKGKPGTPLDARLPASVLGVTSEAFGDALQQYVATNPDGVLIAAEPSVRRKRRRADSQLASSELALELAPRSPEGFRRLMDLKYLASQVDPGEAVGVVAAQSIGEPSTQMTLNTFHMAGRGEANVTLGIPRLRELFMTAAQSIKTPIMTLPLRAGCGAAEATQLSTRLRHICLAEVLAGVTLEETPWKAGGPQGFSRSYKVMLEFADPRRYPQELGLQWGAVKRAFSRSFIAALSAAVKTDLKKSQASSAVREMSIARVGGEEAGATRAAAEGVSARKSEKEEEDENLETNEEYREGKLAWAGGRKEEATYDAGDEEDAAIAKAAARQAAADRGDQEEEEEEALEEPPGSTPTPGATPSPQGAAKGGGGRRKAQSKGRGQAPLVEGEPEIDDETLRAEVSVTLPMSAPKLLFVEMVERLLRTTMVKQTPGIQRTYIIDGSPPSVQTDGISFLGAWLQSDLIDVDNIAVNDVGAVLRTYGVEAARATLRREVQTVFGAYGIKVDPRHLSLITDFMTHQGGYRACNRLGIESSASTFLKISFETAAHFLTEATLRGQTDDLASPASRLVVGRVAQLGTGSHDLIQNLNI